MSSFITPATGDDALAEHVAQLTENFQGIRNIPLAVTGINDPSAYALTLKNVGTGAKGLIIYAADGSTPLLQVDSGGVKTSPDGTTPASTPVTLTGTQILTNKTLVSPIITGTISGITGFSAWTTWPPSLTQGAVVSLVANACRYTVFGKTVLLQGTLTATSAGTATNAIIVGGVPAAIAPLNFNAATVVGSFMLIPGAGAPRTGAVIQNTATTFLLQVDNSAGYLGSVPGVTLANGHTLSFTAQWELA